jgi:chromosome segregation ATPase
MFRFTELSFHGWDLWPAVRIPLDRDVVLVTGPNGSGKTTLLDGIRQLLNAPRLSSRRRLQNYLRRPDAPALIRAVVANAPGGGPGGGPPFRRERITAPEATLACALVPAGGGAPEARARELETQVDAPLRGLAERGELDGPDTVRADLERARRQWTALGEPPPPEVREEALHLRANIEEAERHLGARRREAAEAQEELAECRRRYLEVVSGSLHDYRRRAAELASGAEVAVEMELPRLADDDRVLDEAAIDVRFGFDGKEPLPLGDPSFSGGQQVIAGLILLMAMAETDGRGFFLLDEPFAHLSLDRVDQVGRFLRASRSQFLLTAPTTLDRAQLDPAAMVIVLQKKRPGEPHAPVPIVAEA